MKSITLIFIALMTCAGLIAQTAIAPVVGSGTAGNPYQIASLENLYWIAASDYVLPVPDQETRWSSHYVQIADIDASETETWFGGEGWSPIGNYIIEFTGSYNGENHTIDALHINRPNVSDLGLFGRLFAATIENIGLTNVSITGYGSNLSSLAGYSIDSVINNCYSTGNVTGSSLGSITVGGLVGALVFGSTISDSYCEVNVSSIGSINGLSWVGGLVGTIELNSVINNSYSTGSVAASGNEVGGLVGFSQNSSIVNCHSSGCVNGNNNIGGLVGYLENSAVSYSWSTGNISGGSHVGGLVGKSQQSGISESHSTGNALGAEWMSMVIGGLVGSQVFHSTISNSYSEGDVICMGSINDISRTGGLVAESCNSLIFNCYSRGIVTAPGDEVGGMVGFQYTSTAINSYWDIETSGQTSSAGGEGRTTAEMTYPYAANTFTNWDFAVHWAADIDYTINDGYPYLREPTVSVNNDHIAIIEHPSLNNYPNPFNPETTIKLNLSQDADRLELKIYNIRGQLVRTLIEGTPYLRGEYQVVWDGRNDQGRPVTSGIYFYRMTTSEYEKVNKMLLMK